MESRHDLPHGDPTSQLVMISAGICHVLDGGESTTPLSGAREPSWVLWGLLVQLCVIFNTKPDVNFML